MKLFRGAIVGVGDVDAVPRPAYRDRPVLISTRTTLFLLIALALTPVIWFQAHDIHELRDQRIASAKKQALDLAQGGADREHGLVIEATAILDVAVEVPSIRQADVAGCTALLRGIKQRSPWADGFGLIDMRGHPVCSNDPTFRDVDLSDREYFQDALRSDQVVVSSFLVSRSSGRPNIVLARAVRDPAGRPSGVLVGTIDLDWLRHLVAGVSQDEGSSTMLLDRYGTVVALQPDPEHLVGHNLAHLGWVGDALMRKHAVVEDVQNDGIERLRAVATIPGSGERIVVSFDKAAVLGEAEAEARQSFWRSAVLVVGAALLAWLGGELFFLRWMRRLMVAAERLGRGQFSIDAGVAPIGGELAVIGRAIEAAASRLGHRDHALRQAEAATRDAEALFRGIFDHSTDRLFVCRLALDGGFRFEAINAAAAETFGLDDAEALGCRPDDVLAPATAARINADMARAIATGHPTRFDDDQILEGSAKSWEVVLIPLRSDDRGFDRVFVGIRDISHLKKAEAAAQAAVAEAREANRLLRLAEQMTHVGHWHIDGATNALFLSDEVYRIHGYSPGEVQPTRAWANAAYHPSDRESVTQAFQTAFAGVGFVRFEARLIRPDKEVRHVRVRGFCQANGRQSGQPSMFGTMMDVTELRQAERDAAETSGVLTATLDSMDQGLMVISPAGRIEVCNAQAISLLDLPSALMACRPTLQAVLDHFGNGPEDHGSEPALVRLGGPVEALDTHVHVRPNDVVLEISSMPMGNGGIVRTFTDVTARRAAEAAMRESEARLRLLADTTTDVIAQLGLDLAHLYVSSASHKVLGYGPAELIGQHASKFTHPNDAVALGQMAERLMAGMLPRAEAILNYRFRHKAGHWVWIEAGMTLIRDSGGQPNSIVCSLRDVSERKLAELARAETEGLYRLLSENATDMIVQGDLDTTRCYVSPASRELLGFEPAELVGTSPLDFVHPDDHAAYAVILDDLTSGRTDVATSRQRYRRKDGSYVWTEATFRSLKNNNGNPLGYVGAVRDVSERQAQAEAIEKARAVAEQASQAKTDFLASMSHEIRTPLNGILGYADLLLDTADLGTTQRHQAERIQEAGVALLTIVDDILDFSAIEAGRIELDRQPFNIEGLIDNTVSIVRGTALSKQLEITTDIGGTVPTFVLGDQNRLRQILLNLFNNAIKFTPAGSVRLRVQPLQSDETGTTLHFALTDTGIGISQDKIGRLFQRFSQIDPSIRREFGGTGLGLAISKSLVELMGGEIGVESVVDRGSTFWFTIRLAKAESAVVYASAKPRPRAQQSRRLLLVEDLVINQEIARAVLESMGHVVDVVGDGADAILAVQAGAYDLVLMDVQMPGMDGLTATTQIRALDHPASRVPIVAMTATVLPSQVTQFRATGMNDHIGKPFKRQELFDVVERWTTSRKEEIPNARATPASPLDPDAHEQLRRLVGPEKLGQMLSTLAGLIAERLGDAALDAADPQRLASEAHGIVATAGLLGFQELSAACKQLEAACLQGEPVQGHVVVVRGASRRALDRLEELGRAA